MKTGSRPLTWKWLLPIGALVAALLLTAVAAAAPQSVDQDGENGARGASRAEAAHSSSTSGAVLGDGAKPVVKKYSFKIQAGTALPRYPLKFQNTGTTTWTAAGDYKMKNTVTGTVFNLSKPFTSGGCDGLPPNYICVWTGGGGTLSTAGKRLFTYQMFHGDTPF